MRKKLTAYIASFVSLSIAVIVLAKIGYLHLNVALAAVINFGIMSILLYRSDFNKKK